MVIANLGDYISVIEAGEQVPDNLFFRSKDQLISKYPAFFYGLVNRTGDSLRVMPVYDDGKPVDISEISQDGCVGIFLRQHRADPVYVPPKTANTPVRAA